MVRPQSGTPREDDEVGVEALQETVYELVEVLDELRAEVRVLHHALDEFRNDFTHCLRNLPDGLPPPYAHWHGVAEALAGEPLRADDAPRGRAEPAAEAERDSTPAVSTAAPKPPANAPQPNVASSPPPVELPENGPPPGRRKKRRPLYMRIVEQPVLTDIVRIVGYLRWQPAALQTRLGVLRDKYSHAEIEDGVNELLQERDGQWELSPKARAKAPMLLGKPQ
jgi:hypothetical protein